MSSNWKQEGWAKLKNLTNAQIPRDPNDKIHSLEQKTLKGSNFNPINQNKCNKTKKSHKPHLYYVSPDEKCRIHPKTNLKNSPLPYHTPLDFSEVKQKKNPTNS